VPRKPLIKNRRFMGFIVEEEVATRLSEIARAQGISVAELCRRIINGYLSNTAPQERERTL